MKTVGAFLIGCGLGAAIVNLTLVPQGQNQGLFVGAVLVIFGGVLCGIALRNGQRED